ncbi:MAG: hypothetical protein R2734_08625 [Nocardioides sp.]
MPRLSRLRFMNVDRTRMPAYAAASGRGASRTRCRVIRSPARPACGGRRRWSGALLGQVSVAPVMGRPDFQCSLNAIQCLDDDGAPDPVVPTDLTRWAAADCFTVHMTTSGQARVHIQGEEHLLSPFFALVVSPGMSYRLHFEQDSPPADRAHRTAGPGAAAVLYARPLFARADHL